MNEQVASMGFGWPGFRPVTRNQDYKELMKTGCLTVNLKRSFRGQ